MGIWRWDMLLALLLDVAVLVSIVCPRTTVRIKSFCPQTQSYEAIEKPQYESHKRYR